MGRGIRVKLFHSLEVRICGGWNERGDQVCEKWLKDRRGRTLALDDVRHYQKIVVALRRTDELMQEIDTAVPQWPIQ